MSYWSMTESERTEFVSLEKATAGHLCQIARLHEQGLESALEDMGTRVLQRFYEIGGSDSDCLGYIAVSGLGDVW